MKNYKVIANITYWIGMTLLLVGFLSALWTFFRESSMTPMWSGEGFRIFFSLFDGPIKLLAAGLAVTLAWLTMVRIDQTQEQISILSQNNQFNNYYTHIDKFIEQFVSYSFFKDQRFNLTEGPPISLFMIVYREFYYNHPTEFVPRMNKTAQKHIQDFLSALNNSTIVDSFSFLSLKLSDFNEVMVALGQFGEPFRNYIHSLPFREQENYKTRMRNKNIPEDMILRQLPVIFQYFEIHWTVKLIPSLMVFDGDKVPDLTRYNAAFIGAQNDLNNR